MSNNLLTQDQFDYFKQIVLGHNNKEIIKLFKDKYNKELSNAQVNNLKGNHNLKSGVDMRWKKGQKPANNYKDIGYEYKTQDGYTLVKVAQPSVYKFKHRLIWEKYYGEIPEGYRIIFLDGNINNLDINNLKCVENKTLCMANSSKLMYKNKELRETGLLIAKLKEEEKEKMANIWKRLNKYNKSNYEIAEETNIPEEKVKEIMQGKRQVPTNKVDEFRKSLNTNNKAEKSLKMQEVMNWYNTTDLTKARLDLGYTSQLKLARAIGFSQGTINKLENRTLKYSDDTYLKYYNFLNNSLNKIIKDTNKNTKSLDKTYETKNKEEKIYEMCGTLFTEKEYNEIIKSNKDKENNKIMRLEYELEEARKQIARYEKLIDMIGVDKWV